MKTLTSARQLVLLALVIVALVGPESARSAILRVGDCGPAVSSLQRRLAAARFPSGGVDGCYGPATRYAVVAVQLAHRLRPDGVAGARTQAALRKPLPFAARSRARGTHVEVSLGRQVLAIVRDGRIVSVYATSTGKRGYETPRGTYRVYRKEIAGWSRQYGVPLPWVSYFHRGYAVHAGTIPGYPASHGCVRVPTPFAPSIYRRMPNGSSVVVY